VCFGVLLLSKLEWNDENSMNFRKHIIFPKKEEEFKDIEMQKIGKLNLLKRKLDEIQEELERIK